MDMMQQIQQRKGCTRCHTLKVITDYGTKKNGGRYMGCITCKRRYYKLKDKTMQNEEGVSISIRMRPRRYMLFKNMIQSIFRCILAFKVEVTKNEKLTESEMT